MFVVNRGHDNCILTEYNGVRYCFYRDIPVEISPEVYDNLKDSGHISAQDIRICEEPPEETEEESQEETVIEKVARITNPRGRPKGKKRK